jgi:hypothetical protein
MFLAPIVKRYTNVRIAHTQRETKSGAESTDVGAAGPPLFHRTDIPVASVNVCFRGAGHRNSKTSGGFENLFLIIRLFSVRSIAPVSQFSFLRASCLRSTTTSLSGLPLPCEASYRSPEFRARPVPFDPEFA